MYKNKVSTVLETKDEKEIKKNLEALQVRFDAASKEAENIKDMKSTIDAIENDKAVLLNSIGEYSEILDALKKEIRDMNEEKGRIATGCVGEIAELELHRKEKETEIEVLEIKIENVKSELEKTSQNSITEGKKKEAMLSIIEDKVGAKETLYAELDSKYKEL